MTIGSYTTPPLPPRAATLGRTGPGHWTGLTATITDGIGPSNTVTATTLPAVLSGNTGSGTTFITRKTGAAAAPTTEPTWPGKARLRRAVYPCLPVTTFHTWRVSDDQAMP